MSVLIADEWTTYHNITNNENDGDYDKLEYCFNYCDYDDNDNLDIIDYNCVKNWFIFRGSSHSVLRNES